MRDSHASQLIRSALSEKEMMAKVFQTSVGKAVYQREEAVRPRIIRPPGFSPLRLFGDIRSLIEKRDLLYTLTLHRVNVRYKQSLLGIFWAILQPLSMMLVFTLVFSLIARVPTGGAPYAIFAYTALLPWIFFSTTLTNAGNGLVGHSHLITKIYFPREILPLTYVFTSLFDFLIASSVLAGLLMYYRVPLTLNALYALPIILVLACFATAISLILSATNVRYRDIGVALPLMIQIWMFATPVIYPLSAVPDWLRPFYVLNPMVGIVENFRQVLLYGKSPDFSSLAVSVVITLILLPIAYLYFKHAEATMADII